MTTEPIRLRNEFINTQVITRNTGRRLGVVKEVLVDIDRREVVALGLRDSQLSLSGMMSYMYLSSITKSGDVILVEDEDVLEDVDAAAYSALINSEVITETGEPLGRVRDFQFNLDEGRVSSIIIASLGLPQIPEQVLSTYELSMDEVVSSGPNRLIVFEGAEDRLTQLTVGLLERLGIGRPPWERNEEDLYYTPTARPENQLGTGVPLRPPAPPVETRKPVAIENNWEEDEWEEEPVIAPPPRRQMAETVRYEEYDDEGDNWSNREKRRSPQSYGSDVQRDVWNDDEPDYRPQRINIPETAKTPEYEEETEY